MQELVTEGPITTKRMLPNIARVSRRRRDGADVVTLDIDTGNAAITFTPGQFNMLTVFDVGEVPISFSGNPADANCLRHTVRGVGAVSKALCQLRVGDKLGWRGPFGNGWPLASAEGRDVVIIAGGLGLAPLRPVLYRLVSEREHFGRVVLLYGSRGPADILFQHELKSWRRHLEVDITVDHAGADWHGHVGVVTTLVTQTEFDPTRTMAWVCGPEIMMRFTIAALRDKGLSDEAIYLSMERNMQCGVGHCGHCQFGSLLLCRDGPVVRYDRVRDLLALKEI